MPLLVFLNESLFNKGLYLSFVNGGLYFTTPLSYSANGVGSQVLAFVLFAMGLPRKN
jgi:hypothetical protein